MKKLFFTLALVLNGCLSSFSQATSLTVDCQNPGWLSSFINYGDQQTLKNLKVTGYINGTDIQFIRDLNSKRSLTGVIDLEDVYIISGGVMEKYPYKVEKDNCLPSKWFDGGKHFQKIILPKTLTDIGTSNRVTEGDSVIWTSTNIKSLNIDNNVAYKVSFISIPEGVEQVKQIYRGTRISLPNTITKVDYINYDLIVYSYIENPESVNATYQIYTGTATGGSYTYKAAIANSIIYIPKGTINKYLNSDFAKRNSDKGKKPNSSVPSGNIFIEYYDIDSVVVNSPINMYEGDEAFLEVKTYPNDSLVSWIDFFSNSSEIISVNSEGKIIAKNYGQAEISVTPHVFIDGLKTKTGKCLVNVFAHTEGIDLQSILTIHIGEEKFLNAQTLPLGISDNQLKYESSDPTIADVDENGCVIGHKRGNCTITVTSVDGDYTATCEVSVIQSVEVLSLEKHSMTLKVGELEKLYTQIAPITADNKHVTWSSSNEQVASVDDSGNVTAKKAGECWVKVVSNDNAEAKDSCKVTVIQPVSGITLNHSTYNLNGMGENFILEAKILPDDASNKNVKWTSSNESVCIVSQGQVIAVGEGTCVIIANTEDGGFIATCTVTVKTTTAISSEKIEGEKPFQIYSVSGTKLTHFQSGINIICFADGTKMKVWVR